MLWFFTMRAFSTASPLLGPRRKLRNRREEKQKPDPASLPFQGRQTGSLDPDSSSFRALQQMSPVTRFPRGQPIGTWPRNDRVGALFGSRQGSNLSRARRRGGRTRAWCAPGMGTWAPECQAPQAPARIWESTESHHVASAEAWQSLTLQNAPGQSMCRTGPE